MFDINERRSKPILSIGIVMELTGLTARQVRYYEEKQLIDVARNKGNQRLFSLNQIDQLLQIKQLIEDGFNITDVKKYFAKREVKKRKLDDHEARNILFNDMMGQSPFRDNGGL